MKVVVDLDGTLSRANTYHLWTMATFLQPNHLNRRPLDYARCVAMFVSTYALRAVRLISHHEMKSRFISAFGRLAARHPMDEVDAFLRQFAARIVERRLNPNVKAALQDVALDDGSSPSAVALATAAPSLYARHIAEQLGFKCFATEIPLDALVVDPAMAWQDNRQHVKLRSIARWLNESAFVLFTDHVDDWPLIEQSAKVYLVNPTDKLVQRVRSLSKEFVLLT